MIVTETDDRFYVKQSTLPGAGKGLFAKVPLKKGDRLQVIGVVVRADSVADECTKFADMYKFRMDECLLIPLGYGGMANHSPDPNVEKVIDGDAIYLQVLCPIEKDEELFFRYNEYARKMASL